MLAPVLAHPYFFLIISTVLFPYITYQLTTILFYRTVRSKAILKTPPTIPYWVPGLFHTIGLAFGGSAYFGKLMYESRLEKRRQANERQPRIW